MNAGRIAIFTSFLLAGANAAGAGLGTSAAADDAGRLWIAYAQSAGSAAHVVVAQSDDGGESWRPAVRVTPAPEPVSADGENRPKLAIGPQGELYVSWTSPTSAQYTADIRFSRSSDGGRTWSAPIVVHRDRQVITHRFESMTVDRKGRLWIAWIDKRDLKLAQAAKSDYTGAAVYYAYSDDRGATWRGDFKLADHSCECCRIALATDAQGRALAMWRHVFEGGERDHAIAELKEPPVSIERATYDDWRIDACPHHGPSLAFTPDGTRHAVWFNMVDGRGKVFYGQLTNNHPERVRELPLGAAHADIAAVGETIAVAWKRFDGESTRIESWISRDGGKSFSSGPVLATKAASDQPRLVATKHGVLLVWRQANGTAVRRLSTMAPGRETGKTRK